MHSIYLLTIVIILVKKSYYLMVIKMHINDTLQNFLYDKEYYITIYDNCLYAFNYLKLEKVSNSKIILKFNNFDLLIIGSEFLITKMTKNELRIKGIITKMEYNYENA